MPHFQAIAISLLIAASGCATTTAELSPEAKGVRIVTAAPAGCRYVGEISGYAKGSTHGGVMGMGTRTEDVEDFTRIDLKNNAAKAGADTIQVIQNDWNRMRAEGYHCGSK